VTDPPRYAGETVLETYPVPPSGAPLVIVAYPNRYATGMSNLGYHFIYSSLSRSGRFRIGRCFLGDPPGREAPAAVFFTVSYEEDLLNLVRILVSLGIDPLRERRAGGPLVIAGGPVVSSNPVPFFPLADVLAAGEGEPVMPRIIDAVAGEWQDMDTIAARLSGAGGIILPGRHETAAPAGPAAPELFQHSAIIAHGTAFPDMFLVEVSRGCPGACAFCMATSIYRPFRTMPLERFESILDEARGAAGSAPLNVGLVSTAAAAHPDFTGLMRAVEARGGRVGLSSLRAGDIDAERAEAIGRAGIRSVSLAPESGSESMRVRLGKRSPDQEYLGAARLLRAAGVSRFTLYMLAGLPGEDAGTFVDSERFLSAFSKAAGGARVEVNLNVLVPKPRTPLQFMAMPGRTEIKASVDSMAAVCRSAGVRISAKGQRSSMNQARIALGGEEVGRAAVRYAAGGTSWKRALRDEGVDPDFIHAERGLDDPLPWEKSSGDGGRDALLRRYRALLR
jgi:radical SAM superfamily enzyme YgiQ (UPF0313 family)